MKYKGQMVGSIYYAEFERFLPLDSFLCSATTEGILFIHI